MRKLVIGAVAAVALALGCLASNASAAWVTRTAYRWDPVYCQYVPVTERVWAPDPVVYVPSYYPGYYDYRSWYYPGYYDYRPWYYPGYYRHHEHHEHHHHHH